MTEKLKQAIRGLLNKVNKVTCPHRHGQKVPRRDLDGLANRQVDFEKFLEDLDKSEPQTQLYAIRDKVTKHPLYFDINYVKNGVRGYMGFNNLASADCHETQERAENALSWIRRGDYTLSSEVNIDNLEIVTLSITVESCK